MRRGELVRLTSDVGDVMVPVYRVVIDNDHGAGLTGLTAKPKITVQVLKGSATRKRRAKNWTVEVGPLRLGWDAAIRRGLPVSVSYLRRLGVAFSCSEAFRLARTTYARAAQAARAQLLEVERKLKALELAEREGACTRSS